MAQTPFVTRTTWSVADNDEDVLEVESLGQIHGAVFFSAAHRGVTLDAGAAEALGHWLLAEAAKARA